MRHAPTVADRERVARVVDWAAKAAVNIEDTGYAERLRLIRNDALKLLSEMGGAPTERGDS